MTTMNTEQEAQALKVDANWPDGNAYAVNGVRILPPAEGVEPTAEQIAVSAHIRVREERDAAEKAQAEQDLQIARERAQVAMDRAEEIGERRRARRGSFRSMKRQASGKLTQWERKFIHDTAKMVIERGEAAILIGDMTRLSGGRETLVAIAESQGWTLTNEPIRRAVILRNPDRFKSPETTPIDEIEASIDAPELVEQPPQVASVAVESGFDPTDPVFVPYFQREDCAG